MDEVVGMFPITNFIVFINLTDQKNNHDCTNSTQKGTSQNLNQELSCCEAEVTPPHHCVAPYLKNAFLSLLAITFDSHNIQGSTLWSSRATALHVFNGSLHTYLK